MIFTDAMDGWDGWMGDGVGEVQSMDGVEWMMDEGQLMDGMGWNEM